jgi:cytochrome P450
MMEMKVVLSSILRNFELKTNQRYKDLNIGFELILRPKKGVLVELNNV